MKVVVLGIVFLLVLGLIFFGIPNMDKGIAYEYKLITTTALDGEIVQLSAKYHRKSFKIADDSHDYVLSSSAIPENVDFTFELARKGDRIFKNQNSDTIQLIKGDRSFYFRIKK
ncbi:hypothetical protein [Flavihumibacter petaseus]|uniref:Uncharacterized protein n=1 Tax=Flavihumibacter petaseus NBRC 106054 TaxID=1220578 RepID=A0A0E9N374_9BACT|nr:hypothetical protein [Flavihumibacter petaseus]GAO44121.1 hypothetical protein FPE01S_03_01600 [Flavihumibacter petaseus NBRC 106054]